MASVSQEVSKVGCLDHFSGRVLSYRHEDSRQDTDNAVSHEDVRRKC